MPTSFAVKEIIPPNDDEREKIVKVFANEANMLKEMNTGSNDHILRFITAFTKGDLPKFKHYYLLFEWADGGSLEDLFEQHGTPILNAPLVKLMVRQLGGLAAALKKTHDAKIRHGDLKPLNILRFRPTDDNIIGTLKIGDWGLARYHPESTALRDKKGLHTTTKYFTRFYEPPEVELGLLLGRQYDVWSMGCIILEVVVWLLYGLEGLKQFRDEVGGYSTERVPCYEIVPEAEAGPGIREGRVRSVVVEWMNHMANEPVCNEKTALGVLLRLVQDRLLIIQLPPDFGNTVYTRDAGLTAPRPTRTLPVSPVPEVQITPVKVVELEDDPVIKKHSKTRATSAELAEKFDEELMDASDRAGDFWFRPGRAPRIPKQGFAGRSSISSQNSPGFLSLPSSSNLNQNQRFVSRYLSFAYIILSRLACGIPSTRSQN